MFGKFILLFSIPVERPKPVFGLAGHVRTGFSLETGIRGPAGLGGDTLCIKSTVVLSELQLHRYRICAEFFPDTNESGIIARVRPGDVIYNNFLRTKEE